MNNCSFSILAETKHGYIGQCACCRDFNLAFNNLLINFSEEHLFQFGDWVLENQFNPEFIFELPNGRSRVYQSPVENLFIAFDFDELEELSQLFTETRLVLEARRIVASERHLDTE